VQPQSLNANYEIVRTKLLEHSDEFITTVLHQDPPHQSGDGALYGILQAAVSIRDVQRSLNQISRDERVQFIRNNGNPRISVSVRALPADAEPGSAPEPSAVAENLLKERIRSFGFTVVDDAQARPPADFHVEGDVRFKKLSAKLAASGLTIEKFVLTSWTVKAIDAKSGEEIYHNTEIPQKQSWASEELALQDVGRLIGSEFTQGFFLQYFDFKPKQVQLRFAGVPREAAGALLADINSSLIVLNAALNHQDTADVVIDAQLSLGSAPLAASVQQSILGPLNKKLGADCFTLLSGADAAVLHIAVDSSCGSGAALKRLDAAPQEALAATQSTTI
jgi:serine/threonine-protein kinase